MTPRTSHPDPWRVWVDTGGTFTDCLAIAPDGRVHRAKVLSSSSLRARLRQRLSKTTWTLDAPWTVPAGFHTGARLCLLPSAASQLAHVVAHPDPDRVELDRALPGSLPGCSVELQFDEQAPTLAARLITRTPAGESLPPMAIRLATTRGTNALLERRGGKTALLLNEGLGDLLEIGNQQRPELFALRVVKPDPIHDRVIEVRERLDATLRILAPLDEALLCTNAREALEDHVTCAAVALMHAYRNPEHERAVRRILLEMGFEFVSCSSDVAPLVKILPRAQTTLVDAYLAPVIHQYVKEVRASVGVGSSMRVMTSAGGMVHAEAFLPKDSLLSGPAGGVVGARAAAEAAGFHKLLTFDMGGTSTDVARIDAGFEYVFEHKVGDATVVAPALAIESVAAGGGSICRFDGYRLQVGPQSAGAAPGPACYGAGGPLTVTDVNLLLGRLVPGRFAIPIDMRAAEEALERVLAGLREAGQDRAQRTRILEGFLAIANERMADAVRRISLRKGFDPAEHALVAFGGAGGQSACAVASLLGVATVVVPRDAGLLSALGLGSARIERFAQCQVLEPLSNVRVRLSSMRDELASQARDALRDEDVDTASCTVRALVHIRFRGQDASIAVELEGCTDPEPAFLERYEALYGYRPETGTVEVESMRVVVAAANGWTPRAPFEPGEASEGKQRACFAGRWREVPVVERDALIPGRAVEGPAVVVEDHGTTVVNDGWAAEAEAGGAMIVRKLRGRRGQRAVAPTTADRRA